MPCELKAEDAGEFTEGQKPFQQKVGRRNISELGRNQRSLETSQSKSGRSADESDSEGICLGVL
jgi:hypothetical protein